MRSLSKVLLVGLMMMAMVSLQGCSEDNVCPDPEAGLVYVASTPDTLSVPWTLTLPDGLFAAGQSDTLLESMTPGEYEISWGEVAGWVRGDTSSTTLVLQDASSIHFNSTFVEDDSPTGTISVEPSPLCVDAPWVLSGPDGFITDGSHGAVFFEGMVQGDYTVAWGTVPGWETPDPDTVEQSLADGGSLTFTGVYVEKATGIIVVDPNPDSIEAAWHLDGPDGFSFDGSGDMTLANIMVGDYTVVWTAAENWVTPVTETLAVMAESTTTFTGDYLIDLPLANTQDAVMENYLSVYEGMFFEGYESLLHESHQTLVLQSTIEEWEGSDNPLLFPYFDRNQTVAIHDNIFHGRVGVGPSGLAIPPIDSISIPLLEKLGPWEHVPAFHEYFGELNAYYTHYEMLAHFNKPDGTRYQVDHLLTFYTAEVDGEWKLLGIESVLNNEMVSTDSITYDEVLSLYR